MSDDRMITEQELATRWGVSVRTIKRWRKEKEEGRSRVPPSYPLGRRGGFGQGVTYLLSEVEAFEAAAKNGAAATNNEGSHQ